MQERLVLQSDYQEKGEPIPIVAGVHAIIKSLKTTINAKDLTYKHLKATSIGECKDLEREWFPPWKPEDSYYLKSLDRKSYFTICCYWKPKEEKEEEYVIGNIIVKVDKNNKAMNYFCNNKFDPNQKEEEQVVNAKNNFGKTIAYICSIGVIDEARRLGIGTKLVESANEYAAKNYRNCVGVSLHVISTGKRAIGLYERCKFTKLFTEPKYYNMSGKRIDAFCYAKSFDKPYIDNNLIVEFLVNFLLKKVKMIVRKLGELIKAVFYIKKAIEVS